MAVIDQLRHRVGEATGADVVQHDDGIGHALQRCACAAGLDDLLCAPLDLRIAALDRGEVEVGGTRAAAHRRGGAAAEADQHRRTTEHDKQCANRHFGLLDIGTGNIAEATGDHDGLVIAARRGLSRHASGCS
jgi:hypothetical protein